MKKECSTCVHCDKDENLEKCICCCAEECVDYSEWILNENSTGKLPHMDTQRLDALQKTSTGNGWILRKSARGMRLHETSLPDAKATIRDAIDSYFKKNTI